MSKDNGDLEKSVKEIPGLTKVINKLITTLTFSAEAKNEILDGTKLILPEKMEITEKVFIKDGDKEIPAPNGKYKFEDRKDIITIKNGVIKDIKIEAAEHQVTDVKTTEGIILRYDAEIPEIGLDIFIVKDTGQEPAPDGDHELENGMVLTVQDGKITNITQPEGTKDEGNKEEDMAKVNELIGELKKLGVTVETMKTENKELKKDNEEIKKEHTTLSETLKLTFKIVEIISEQPSDDSKGTKGTFANDEKVVDIVAEVADFKADIKRLRLGQTN